VRGREAGPAVVGGEQRANLLLGGACVRTAGGQAAGELGEVQVAGRELVVAALAVQREHLDRPAPDPGDRAQPAPAPLVVGGAQVHAAAGDLARGAAQRQRAAGGEVEALQQGGRRGGEAVGGGQVAQPGGGAPAAEPPHDPSLDRDRAVELDELLCDRPGQGLERVGPAVDAQPRPVAHRRADQRVRAEPLVERAQVVVEPEREAHPGDALLGLGAARRPGPEQHLVAGGLGDADDNRHAVDVHEALEH